MGGQGVLHGILNEYSAANRYPRLCVEVLNIFFLYTVWASIGEKILSTFLHSSWERVSINLIFQSCRHSW